MGNKNRSRSSRPVKRKFRGNQHKAATTSEEKSTRSVVDDSVQEDIPCSSAKKIRPETVYENQSTDTDPCQGGFVLMNLDLLFNFITSNMRCDKCCHYSLSCGLKEKSKSGFGHEIEVKCCNCDNWEVSFKTSGEGTRSGHSEVNLRMVAFVRSLGRGFSALENFSLYVNTPPPMTQNNYKKIFRSIHSASKDVALESMNCAAAELRKSDSTNDTSADISDADVVDKAVYE